jgi:hypothetical protein
MSRDDPPRLKQARDTSPTLVRALEALRKGADETARLERVASKLEPLLDAAPKGASVSGGARLQVTAFKLIIGCLALLAPALWLMRNRLSEQPQAGMLPNASAKVVTLPPEAAAEPVALPRTEPVPPSPDTTQQPTASTLPDHAYHGQGGATRNVRVPTHGRQQPSEARPAASVRSTASTVAANPTPPAPEIAQTPRQLEHSASAPSAEPQRPTVMQPTAATSTATTNPVSPSEAELLFDARKAMPSDAARALQLLAEHEKRYPNGMLVPEREVLAIEALRSMGRKAEADARLLRFEARYPNSFHLDRLQR